MRYTVGHSRTRTWAEVPDDFWGLTITRVKEIIKESGIKKVWLTNLRYKYKGYKHEFGISDVGNWRIVGERKDNAVDSVMTLIAQEVKKNQDTKE